MTDSRLVYCARLDGSEKKRVVSKHKETSPASHTQKENSHRRDVLGPYDISIPPHRDRRHRRSSAAGRPYDLARGFFDVGGEATTPEREEANLTQITSMKHGPSDDHGSSGRARERWRSPPTLQEALSRADLSRRTPENVRTSQ